MTLAARTCLAALHALFAGSVVFLAGWLFLLAPSGEERRALNLPLAGMQAHHRMDLAENRMARFLAASLPDPAVTQIAQIRETAGSGINSALGGVAAAVLPTVQKLAEGVGR